MNGRTKLVATALVGLSLAAGTRAGAQIAAGHVDTFQDGTTQNWRINLLGLGPPPPATLPSVQVGGQGGAGDLYLQLHSSGNLGPGGRLTVVNFNGQWMGNYLAAGVTGIALDANNTGSTDLHLRLLFEDPIFAPPLDVAASAIPIVLPAGSGWQHLVFPLVGPGGLATLQGNLNTLLGNTTAIRIFHLDAGSPPADRGDPIAATLGVDNITALAAPEPSGLALLGTGAAAALVLRRRKAR